MQATVLVNFMSTRLDHTVPRYVSNIILGVSLRGFLGVSLRGFLDEINMRITSLSKANWPSTPTPCW